MSYRPPSCDLPPEFYRQALKKCPCCGGKSVWYDYNKTIKCTNTKCYHYGPINDPHGHSWNSTPHRSEVAELLGDIDLVAEAFELTEWGGSNFIKTLKLKADRLRKEWNL